MRLFLHVGSHKTGTTAIQRFAAQNSSWLKERGLSYPNLDLIGLPKKRSHLAVFSGLCDLPGFDYGVSRSDSLRFLVAAAEEVRSGPSPSLLLSAESIWRMSMPVKDLAFGVVAGIFHDFSITVIAGIRRQDRLFESMYRNDFKRERLPAGVKVALDRREEVLDYGAALEAVDRWFPEGAPSLLPYSAENRSTYVYEFFRALGVDIPEVMTPPQTANLSYDVVDCLALRELYRRKVSTNVISSFRDFIFDEPISTDFTFLDSSLVARLQEQYSEGNRRVVERFPELRRELAWDEHGTSHPDDERREPLLAEQVERRLQRFTQRTSGLEA